jgi:hypothetical protein
MREGDPDFAALHPGYACWAMWSDLWAAAVLVGWLVVVWMGAAKRLHL